MGTNKKRKEERSKASSNFLKLRPKVELPRIIRR